MIGDVMESDSMKTKTLTITGKKVRVPYYDGSQESLQRYFDKTVAHLMQQGERSVTLHSDHCAFRSGELRCAIGVHIPDGYRVTEDEGPSELFYKFPELEGVARPVGDEPSNWTGLSLSEDLMGAHDEPDNWDETGFVGIDHLEEIALQYGLVMPKAKS